MSEDLQTRRKRLKFRSWHRGTKETDLILGRFADLHLDQFDGGQLDCYEALLAEEDPDIYAWVTGAQAVPERMRNPVLDQIMGFRLADYLP